MLQKEISGNRGVAEGKSFTEMLKVVKDYLSRSNNPFLNEASDPVIQTIKKLSTAAKNEVLSALQLGSMTPEQARSDAIKNSMMLSDYGAVLIELSKPVYSRNAAPPQPVKQLNAVQQKQNKELEKEAIQQLKIQPDEDRSTTAQPGLLLKQNDREVVKLGAVTSVVTEKPQLPRVPEEPSKGGIIGFLIDIWNGFWNFIWSLNPFRSK